MAAVLHLFSPVQLYDAQTNQPVATVYHFLVNWLYVPGAGKVRVDGSSSAKFRPIPARCRVEILDKRMASFLLESGFMRPGGSRPRSGRLRWSARALRSCRLRRPLRRACR